MQTTLITTALVFGSTIAMFADSAGNNVSESVDTVYLSLEQCIELALNDNPSVKVADLDITRVDYSRKETLGQLLPTVNFGGTYSRMLAKQVAYMNFDLGDLGNLGGGSGDESEQTPQSRASKGKRDDGFKMGLDNSFQLGFSASMPLIAPQLWQSMKLSDAQIAVTVEQARATRLNLVNAVKTAYYTYLLAKDSQRVIGESYDMASLTHNTYVKQQQAGAASEYDVLRTEVAMQNIEPEITQADIALRRARMQMLILLGLPADAPVTFSGSLSDYQGTMYEKTLQNINDDISQNSTLKLNRLQTETMEKAVTVHRMAWMPTLALSGNYNWTSSSDGNPFKNFRWNPYSIVALTLNIPLFEGGQRYHRLRQAQIQVHQSTLQRQDLERSIRMQTDLALRNIILNVKQIESSGHSVAQAEKAHNIMVESFDIGAASYLDLRDSELALTRAQLAYYQTVFNYLVAEAELELLRGDALTK